MELDVFPVKKTEVNRIHVGQDVVDCFSLLIFDVEFVLRLEFVKHIDLDKLHQVLPFSQVVNVRRHIRILAVHAKLLELLIVFINVQVQLKTWIAKKAWLELGEVVQVDCAQTSWDLREEEDEVDHKLRAVKQLLVACVRLRKDLAVDSV